jgi:hypothetical protein
MLGRLRMTIEQALRQYYEVGNHVFKRPRLHGRGKLGRINDRLDGTYMDEVLKKATISPPTRQHGQDVSGTVAPVEGSSIWPFRRAEKDLKNTIDYDAHGVRMRNPGADSARTYVSYPLPSIDACVRTLRITCTCSVVVACTMAKREPYLFRSYDHPSPNPALTGNELNGHLNAGPAQDVALWKAGRATSAAPGWFPSIKIGGHWFQDGAVAEYNNPINVAFNEVKQMLPSQDPSVIISIGTGVKLEKQGAHSDPRKVPSRWGWYKDSIAQYKRWLGNSVKAHEDFKTRLDKEYKHSKMGKPKYFRWDVPAGFPKVKLGDWNGIDGVETREALREPTESYCKDQVRREIQECANRLVEIRRRRAKTARWESFALDSRLYYVCPLSIKHGAEDVEFNIPGETSTLDEDNTPDEANRHNVDCKDLRFDSRISLRQHAIDNHGFVWHLRCGYFPTDHTANQPDDQMTPHSHIDWSCVWDHCEMQVSAFDEEADFSRHLRAVHGHQNPRVYGDDREFEKWLDSGRVVVPPGNVSISQQGTFQRTATWESRLG